MTAVSINLTEPLRARLESLAERSGFAGVKAYVEAMVRADAACADQLGDAPLEPVLLDRVDGPFVEVNVADFKQIHQKLKKRLASRSEKRP